MSEKWMKTSFFPLLPLDAGDGPNAKDLLLTSHPSPSQNYTTSSSVKESSKSSHEATVLTSTTDNCSPTGHHCNTPSLAANPSVAGIHLFASTSSQVNNSPLVETSMAASSQELSSVELVMFDKIISSGCIIKSQQRGDPDLSHSELCSELAMLLKQKPGAFLMRYGRYLDSQDLEYFDSMQPKNDFEVNFRLGRLRVALNQSSKSRSKKIRNRRYECLRHLMKDSSYFSEEEMKQRNPLLYDFYIGQYLSEEEKQRDMKEYTDMTLSSMILNKMDQDKTTELYRRQRKSEIEQLSSVNATSCDVQATSKKQLKSLKAMELSFDPVVADREKYMLRQEFLSAMQTHFLEGKDDGFDYSSVDNDEQYDSLDMRERDEQDSYFDEEEPSWTEEGELNDANMEIT